MAFNAPQCNAAYLSTVISTSLAHGFITDIQAILSRMTGYAAPDPWYALGY